LPNPRLLNENGSVPRSLSSRFDRDRVAKKRFGGSTTGNSTCMIGKLRTIVVDCKNPETLAGFYAEVIGGHTETNDADWVVLTAPGGTRLAFQRSPEHVPPHFPDPTGSQQFHLDIQVDDVDEAEREVLALGATRIPDVGNESGNPFRVYRDPAGHTFCLVWGVPYLTT
jgi:catechol 2,3-dioxygenase-like lactoylglutathione lyase family enzyme